MKKGLIVTLAFLLVAAILVAVLEGIHSLAKGRNAHVSLSYQALLSLGAAGEPKAEEAGTYAPFLADARELADLIGPAVEAGVRIGNTPYPEFETDKAALNTKADGCLRPKPSQHKIGLFLRSPLFNPFDPITVFYDADQKLDQRLAAFFARYGNAPIFMSTNAEGERVTLPSVERPRKVLVAGDSVAFGAMIDDEDTIASQLQVRDLERQYVNLGTSGARAADIVCRLEAMLPRYAGQVDELIYVYCENDFRPKDPYGKPEEVIAWLTDFAAREKIAKVTVVFAPSIYMVAPEVTRFDGYRGGSYPYRHRERETLMEAVEAAGFRWVDIGVLAREELARRDSPFAFYALFIDHNHLSRDGTARLVDALLAE
jgi:hypothetical protein